MIFRLFLDANILFTAAYTPDGLSALLFDIARQGFADLLSSEHAIEEARVNLELKKPGVLGRFNELQQRLRVVQTPAQSPISLQLPEDDLAIFAAALAARATHLLTGDKKHFSPYFGKPQSTGGVHIQTVRQFFEERFPIS